MDLRFHWTKKILHAEIVRAEALDFVKEIKGGWETPNACLATWPAK